MKDIYKVFDHMSPGPLLVLRCNPLSSPARLGIVPSLVFDLFLTLARYIPDSYISLVRFVFHSSLTTLWTVCLDRDRSSLTCFWILLTSSLADLNRLCFVVISSLARL